MSKVLPSAIVLAMFVAVEAWAWQPAERTITAKSPFLVEGFCQAKEFVVIAPDGRKVGLFKSILEHEKRMRALEGVFAQDGKSASELKLRLAILEKKTERYETVWHYICLAGLVVACVAMAILVALPLLQVVWPHFKGWLDRRCERVFGK